MTTSTPRIEDVRSTAYTIPTDQPESDGTLKWDSTTLLLVQAKCGQTIGLGYTYADSVTATLICEKLAPLATGADAFDIPRVHAAMVREMRNLGRTGISAMAISAVDNAL